MGDVASREHDLDHVDASGGECAGHRQNIVLSVGTTTEPMAVPLARGDGRAADQRFRALSAFTRQRLPYGEHHIGATTAIEHRGHATDNGATRVVQGPLQLGGGTFLNQVAHHIAISTEREVHMAVDESGKQGHARRLADDRPFGHPTPGNDRRDLITLDEEVVLRHQLARRQHEALGLQHPHTCLLHGHCSPEELVA
ncbi:unannotated protein [freshwater metagenome]|uniref:Unannotated protein n=2 Tax=freshwater metagenome TaxID=449393 RepID=A0A6J7NUI2_9ZZZZ